MLRPGEKNLNFCLSAVGHEHSIENVRAARSPVDRFVKFHLDRVSEAADVRVRLISQRRPLVQPQYAGRFSPIQLYYMEKHFWMSH